MATTTRGVPFPATSDNNATVTWLSSMATWVNDAPGIATLTTTQRDALSGGALWTGRVIYNTTLKQFEYYAVIGSVNWQVLGVPRGTIVWMAHKPATVVPGYLDVVGGIASTTTYADLFALVGTKYNTGGEGAGNFRLPNLKRRMPVGFDDTDLNYETGDVFGTETGTFAVPAHTHTISHAHNMNHSHGNTGGFSLDHTHSMQGHTHSGTTDVQGAHGHNIGAGTQLYWVQAGQPEGVPGPGSAGRSGTWADHAGHQHNMTTGGPSAGSTGGASADHVHSVPAFSGNTGANDTANSGSTGSATTFDLRNPAMVLYPMIKY